MNRIRNIALRYVCPVIVFGLLFWFLERVFQYPTHAEPPQGDGIIFAGAQG